METFYRDCHGDYVTDDAGLWMDDASPCYVCNTPTHRLDVNFHVPLHSGRCEDTLVQEYQESLAHTTHGTI